MSLINIYVNVNTFVDFVKKDKHFSKTFITTETI